MKIDIFLKKIQNLLGKRFSISDSTRANYAGGEDIFDPVLPLGIAFPETTQEISNILKLCNTYSIPVIPFGTGTSLEGHVLGNQNGITVSLEKLNKIIIVNSEDFDCRVEAYVTRKQLNEYIKDQGIFFPIDP
ncbi:uncharacterized protein METZ01_LOCUS394169, partial [marine metagenome]